MDGFSFDGGIPMMDGTWYNPDTGDSFTVRDTFLEDNIFTVLAMDGRRFTYNQIQNYIKSDRPIPKKPKAPKKKIEAKASTIIEPADFDDLLTEEDKLMLAGLSIDSSEGTPIYTEKVKEETKDISYQIIDKVLKDSSIPEVKCSIWWADVPTKQIKTLNEVLNISEEEIVKYLSSKVKVDNIYDLVKTELKNRISSILKGE